MVEPMGGLPYWPTTNKPLVEDDLGIHPIMIVESAVFTSTPPKSKKLRIELPVLLGFRNKVWGYGGAEGAICELQVSVGRIQVIDRQHHPKQHLGLLDRI